MKPVILCMLLCFLITTCSFGQISFHFAPELYGRSIDGLSTFQVQNLSGAVLRGKIMIVVKEITGGQTIASILTPVSAFSTGNSRLPKSVFSGSAINFGQSATAKLVQQTRQFPPGQYNFCFYFADADKGNTEDYETCFESEVLPLVPLSLIHPADGDRICQKRPMLSWLPPMPFMTGTRFRLLLTEKKQGASVENLLVNAPLLLLDNITSHTVQYPSSRPELKEGVTYCWQVIAYQQGLVLCRSEIWEFTVQCNETAAPVPYDSYRELKQLVNGNYYIANRVLKFSFNNHYNVQKLNYVIQDIEKGFKTISHTPEIKLQQGLNKVDIDLDGLDLGPGKHYLLKVFPFNEPAVEIRFVYEEDQTL